MANEHPVVNEASTAEEKEKSYLNHRRNDS
jgi:hypothetical protein